MNAQQKIIKFFRQWDTGGIPTKSQLEKMKKDDIIALLDTYRENPPSKGEKPLVWKLVKHLWTDPELDTLTKDELIALVNEAFNERGIKSQLKTIDAHPSQYNYRPVQRRRVVNQ